MSRSDGNFPEYDKLRLDPAKPPPDYWGRGVRRCSECEVAWPNFDYWKLCPRDQKETIPMRHAPDSEFGDVKKEVPDMAWRQATTELLVYQFNNFYEAWNEGKSDVELAWESEQLGPDHELMLEHFRLEIEDSQT